MGTSKHTPGPWHVEDTNGAKLHCVVVSNHKGANGSWVIIGQIGGPDKKANARLIAATPELLEALSDLVTLIDNVAPAYSKIGAVVSARAALAKAGA
jgi:hypothetical protein